jgi:hypothetical protein
VPIGFRKDAETVSFVGREEFREVVTVTFSVSRYRAARTGFETLMTSFELRD